MRYIESVEDLSEVVTAVANRALEIVTERSSSGQYYIGYDHVSDLIRKEDYETYFNFIVHEVESRAEVLDLQLEDDIKELDINCGLAWCKGYDPLPDEVLDFEPGEEDLIPAPSLAHLAVIGQKLVEHIADKSCIPAEFTDYGITEEDIAFGQSILDARRRYDRDLNDPGPVNGAYVVGSRDSLNEYPFEGSKEVLTQPIDQKPLPPLDEMIKSAESKTAAPLNHSICDDLIK